MFISHHSGAQCYLGSYRNRRFYPEQHYRLNWPGGSYFATESLESPDGRRIVWAWVCEQRHPSDWSSEWSAVFSLPRVLSIDEDGTLLMQPAEELKKLRKNHKQRRDIHLKPGQDIRLKRISGDCLEILLRVNPMKSEKVGLKVRCAPDLSEYTEISYNASLSTLSINTERASLSPNIIRPYPNPYAARDPNALAGNKRQDITIQTAPFSLNKGELLEFHIFIDKSIIEVFANGRQAMVQRIYPTRKDSKEIILFSKKNSAWVYSLDAWDISPCEISPETVNDVKN
jgi:beta-fructofuranosidase